MAEDEKKDQEPEEEIEEEEEEETPARAINFEGMGYGGILRYDREAIFFKISRGEELGGMILHFFKWGVLLAACLGATLGFHVANIQILVSAIKVPVLIWATMGICLPLLYAFNIQLGSKLSFKQTATVLSVGTYTMAHILGCMAPIMFVFVMSTESKDFIVLLNVVAFTIAGLFGVRVVWAAMEYMIRRAGYEPNRTIIQVWTAVYIFAGLQMAWLMRPFFGYRGEFAIFRDRGGVTIYEAIFGHFINLFRG